MNIKNNKVILIHRILIVLLIVLAAAIITEISYKVRQKSREMKYSTGEYIVFPGMKTKNKSFDLNIDLVEKQKEYVIRCDVPGMNKQDIEVSVDNGSVTISGIRENEKSDEGKTFFYKEREYGSFRRRIALPGKVKKDLISAEYRNGMLIILLPKQENGKEEDKNISLI